MNLPVSKTMGSRTVEVRPVGAWVYPEVMKNQDEMNAQASASHEEARIRTALSEKERRLRQFQEDVRQRVQKLGQQKRQQQLHNSAKAVEVERHVIKQSVLAAHKTTPRKNNCSIRANHADLSIRQNPGERGKKKHIETDLSDESTRVHRHTRRARSKLVSRKVHLDDYGRDNLVGNQASPATSETSDPNTQTESEVLESAADVSAAQYTNSADQRVHFDLHSLRNQLNRLEPPFTEGVASGSGLDPVSSVPEIYPGQTSQNEKRQSVQQRALYRRLFMDIEREEVREKQRREKHRHKITELKKAKEEDRKRVELASLRLTQSETDLPESEPEEQEVDLTEELERSEREEERKNREANRFVEALKQSLREKLSQRDVQLPTLCCCGDTIWDTHPDRCANNCVFYKNHKAYTKALQCVLASCDTL